MTFFQYSGFERDHSIVISPVCWRSYHLLRNENIVRSNYLRYAWNGNLQEMRTLWAHWNWNSDHVPIMSICTQNKTNAYKSAAAWPHAYHTAISKLGTWYNKGSKQEHLTSITWLRRMYELYIYIYIYVTPDNYTLWVFQSHGYISKLSRGVSIITEHHARYTRSECGYNYSTLTIFQQCLINLYTVCGQRLGLSSL